jgi:hypothetical protein
MRPYNFLAGLLSLRRALSLRYSGVTPENLLRRVNTGAEYWTVCPVPIQRACYATTNRSPTHSPFAT